MKKKNLRKIKTLKITRVFLAIVFVVSLFANFISLTNDSVNNYLMVLFFVIYIAIYVVNWLISRLEPEGKSFRRHNGITFGYISLIFFIIYIALILIHIYIVKIF